MRPALALLLATLAAAAGCALAGCATPVAPTGGPADTTPPSLVASLPAARATRVTGREVRLTFSERLDAASAARAVAVTPAGADPPRVRVDGAELVVDLPPLRPATTYVVTVGTALADARRVALAAPVTLAFSTGDRIDTGRIDGRVRRPADGAPASGLAVWAYALADTLADTLAARPDVRTAVPDYRAETGRDGRFRLDYLRDGAYLVVAVADADRDGRADDGEALAVPPAPAVRADSAGGAGLALWAAVADTTAPAVRSARALSDRRLAVRFTEAVRLRSSAGWAAEDSTTGALVALAPAVTSPAEVTLVGAAALPGALRVRLDAPDALADSAGNAARPFARAVAPQPRPDTLTARVAGFVPGGAPDSTALLRPGEAPGVRFTSRPEPGRLRLLAPDGTDVAARVETDDGLLFRLVPERPLAPGEAVTLAVDADGPRRAFRRPRADETGSLAGTVPDAPPDTVVELTPPAGPPVLASTGAAGRFAFDGLVPGAYRLRVWDDRDGDGRWSPGRLAPYTPPERLLVVDEPETVRARWETEVEPERLALPPDAP